MRKTPEGLTIEEQRKLLKDRGICVVIPTYNNVGTIADVVRRSKEQCDDVIVVSDGANDGTNEVLSGIDGISVVELKKNRGKGTALKSGFKKALESGFSYAITIDADGQHFPEDIPLLLEANMANPGAIIVGERKDLEKAERSAGSKFANKFSNFWFVVQTACNLRDTQTGYRLYPLKKLYGLNFLTSRYEAELELLVFASWHGVKIVSTPVNVYYPPREERVSHFRPIRDFSRISILNTILCVLALVYGYPLMILRWLRQLLFTVYAGLFYLLICLLVLTPITLIYINVGGKNRKKEKHLRYMLHLVAKFVMVWHGIPGCKFSCEKHENANKQGGSIMVCNHQSHLDLMAILSQFPNVAFLTNDWVWNSPFFGYVIRNAGYIPASQEIEKTENKIKKHLEDGTDIVIFPEGTRSKDCEIMRFHSGAFLLARELKANITPLILYGAGQVLPKGGKMLRKGKIILSVEPVMTVAQLNSMSDTVRGMASKVRKYYQRRYSEMKNKIEQNV